MSQYQAGEWPVDYSLAECGPFETSNSSGLQFASEIAAINMLWNWTGHQFGSTEVTIRPELAQQYRRPSTWEGRGPRQMTPYGGSFWMPVVLEGHVYSLRCGCQSLYGCTCSPNTTWALALPGKPQSVSAVEIGATVLDPSEYRLEGDSLIKADGYWPTYQNLRLQLGEVGTWGVTYVKGLPVPKGGELAAGVLSCEIAKALVRDSTCRLPVRIQQLVGNGTGERLQDTYGAYLEFGKTGLYIIDSWVDSVLVHRSRPTVRSVDLPGMR